MEDKGYAIKFKNQQVLIRPKESSLGSAQVIKVREGNLYKLQRELIRALVHNTNNLCKLCYKRMGAPASPSTTYYKGDHHMPSKIQH